MDYNNIDPYMYQQPGPAEAGFMMGQVVFSLIWAVIVIIGLWKVFQKAGHPGWAAIVPIYNIYILLKIVGKPGWWLLLYFIPLVNIIVALVVALELAKRFGKSQLFAIFLLFLFHPIGILILGFGKSKYMGESATPEKPTPPTTEKPKAPEAPKPAEPEKPVPMATAETPKPTA